MVNAIKGKFRIFFRDNEDEIFFFLIFTGLAVSIILLAQLGLFMGQEKCRCLGDYCDNCVVKDEPSFLPTMSHGHCGRHHSGIFLLNHFEIFFAWFLLGLTSLPIFVFLVGKSLVAAVTKWWQGE